MNIEPLEEILVEHGLSVDERVAKAEKLLSGWNKILVLPTLDELRVKYADQLEVQSERMHGVQHEVEWLDAFADAHEVCVKLLAKYRD